MNSIGEENTTLTLQIRGTFDIAVARNRMRQLADCNKLSTILRARASAAITTIAEMVLFKTREHEPNFTLYMLILDDDGKKGVEFDFEAPFASDIVKHFVVAEWQLERTCDELGIQNRGEYDSIVMRLWDKGARA